METALRKLEKSPFTDTQYRKEILKAGSRINEKYAPPECDIVCEKNVPVILRDGVKIYTDIFRPADEGRYPAITAWSPYGKEFHGPPVKGAALSGLQKFEGPDPAFWVKNGYAVVNPDIRGTGNSEGIFFQWGEQMARDGYDFTEFVAGLPWCSGRVSFSGTSYLAISQWFIAAKRPPSLACIAPWEGFCDVYRHSVCAGGIPDPEFESLTFEKLYRGPGSGEDFARMILDHPFMNEYWEEKRAKAEDINVPAYVTASYTNKVHTRGTFDAFENLGSEKKWLRIHNTHEWHDYYNHQEDLLKFFDRYLKDKDNGWENTPKVRMAVLNPGGEDITSRPEEKFPPERVCYKEVYFDGTSRLITDELPEKEAEVSYNSADGKSSRAFAYTFKERTEITGKIRVKLWIETSAGNDMDIFVMAKKLDGNGDELKVCIEGAPYCAPGQKASFEWGNGRQRASCSKSLYNPEVIEPGMPQAVEIELCCMDMIFEAGQKLELSISGFYPGKGELPEQHPPKTINKGEHIIHTGGIYDSKAVIPVL